MNCKLPEQDAICAAQAFPWKLPYSEVADISRSLTEDWGISHLTHADYVGKMMALDDEDVRTHDEAWEDSYNAAQQGRPLTAGSEQSFFAAIARPGLHGLVTSRHRPTLIDVAAIAIAVIRRENITGTILDVGCHAGHLTSIIADRVDNKVVGIDPIEEAITAADAHPARNKRIEFRQVGIPLHGSERFGLIVSVDAIHSVPSQDHLKNYGRLLEDEGVAIVTSREFYGNWSRIPAAARKAGLSVADIVIVGGYGGACESHDNEFGAQVLLVLRKAAGPSAPRNVSEAMGISQRWWDAFATYANDPATPDHQKTQAFFLSNR